MSALVLAVCVDAAALGAQSFEGSGQQATELFSLSPGLVVFEVEHRGSGAFTVRLLSEQGELVEELARGSGVFQGSKAVRVPQSGRYLLDVAATGPWNVRRRAAAAPAEAAVPDTASPAYKAAMAAADEISTAGWLARGFVGGAVAGPVGAALAVAIAGRSGVSAPVADGSAGYGPDFETAFASRVRQQRRKHAFVGGMIGTGVFVAGLIWALDIAGGGSGGAPGTGTGGGSQFVLVPH